MSRMSRVPPGDESARRKMSQIFQKSALPDENCDEIFVLSRGYAATDETISSDNWSHITRGDGLNEMVQYRKKEYTTQ